MDYLKLCINWNKYLYENASLLTEAPHFEISELPSEFIESLPDDVKEFAKEWEVIDFAFERCPAGKSPKRFVVPYVYQGQKKDLYFDLARNMSGYIEPTEQDLLDRQQNKIPVATDAWYDAFLSRVDSERHAPPKTVCLTEQKKNSKEVKRLCVFDFDGTLFRSPEPPSDFKGNWNASKESLGEPNVPEIPQEEWWFKTTVAAAESAIADEDTYSIMMTGRMDRNFHDRIIQLLHQQSLEFEDVFLNDSGQDTVDFKVSKINKFIKKFPNLKKLEMWEDKQEHIEKFTEALDNRGFELEIHKVEPIIGEASKIPNEPNFLKFVKEGKTFKLIK